MVDVLQILPADNRATMITSAHGSQGMARSGEVDRSSHSTADNNTAPADANRPMTSSRRPINTPNSCTYSLRLHPIRLFLRFVKDPSDHTLFVISLP